jgi:hypothetical protein
MEFRDAGFHSTGRGVLLPAIMDGYLYKCNSVSVKESADTPTPYKNLDLHSLVSRPDDNFPRFFTLIAVLQKNAVDSTIAINYFTD